MAVGLVVLTQLEVDLNYVVFAAGLVVFAAGVALSGAPATTAIVSSLSGSKQGVASAVNDTSRELGSALGIAILGSTLNSGYSSGIDGAVSNLPDDVAERARESISFVQQGAGRLGADVLAQAEQAFVDATTTSLLVAAGALLATAVVVAVRAPRRE